MSKRILILLMVLAAIQSTVAVSPAAATSTDVILTHIQAGVTGGATQEFIGIYNTSTESVDISDWCLKNKSGSDFACFTDQVGEQGYRLPSHSSVTVASHSFLAAQPIGFTTTLPYEPSSQSSGSLVGSNDRVTLVDHLGIERDSYVWTASIASGSIFKRKILTDAPFQYSVGGGSTDWGVYVRDTLPADQVEVYQKINDTVLPVIPSIYLTELLANAEGSDEGKEYIEFYNAGTGAVDIGGYYVLIGLTPTAPTILPNEFIIEPQAYRVLYNFEVNFSLVNTNGMVRVALPTGETIDETDAYMDPKEDEVWALIDGIWQYSHMPTPGAENLLTTVFDSVPLAEVVLPKPCAANQYRSPDTGRCRLIATTASQPAPCQPDQYRSAETGRCRKVAVASVPTPCKEGQERNEETDRCRAVKAMTTSDYSVLAATTTQRPSQWYIIWVIVAIAGVLIAYAAWEWRGEVRRLSSSLIKFVRKGK